MEVKKKCIGFLGNGTMKVLTDEEKKQWDYVNQMNNRKFIYSIGDALIYNISEVDGDRAMERYLNGVRMKTETKWQSRMKYTWWVATGILSLMAIILYYMYGMVGDKLDVYEQKMYTISKNIETFGQNVGGKIKEKGVEVGDGLKRDKNGALIINK